MLDRFLGLPTGLLHWLLYSRAGSGRGWGSWSRFEIVHDHPLFMNATAKKNSSRKFCLFIEVKNYCKGLGVTLLGCRLNSSFYGSTNSHPPVKFSVSTLARPITCNSLCLHPSIMWHMRPILNVVHHMYLAGGFSLTVSLKIWLHIGMHCQFHQL